MIKIRKPPGRTKSFPCAMILSQITSVEPVWTSLLLFFLASGMEEENTKGTVNSSGTTATKEASLEHDKYANGRAEDMEPQVERGNINTRAER